MMKRLAYEMRLAEGPDLQIPPLKTVNSNDESMHAFSLNVELWTPNLFHAIIKFVNEETD